MEMSTEYGNRLRAARKFAGLTQEQLRDKTGIAQSTISSAERDGNGSAETPVYAKACGVSALWLATGEGNMLDGATFTEVGTAKPQRAVPLSPEIERKMERIVLTVYNIQPDRRAAALSAALEVLIDHLPPAASA
jgi:transcriptional regulator with XRE-family HTH domain